MASIVNRFTRLTATMRAIAFAVALLLIPACGQIGPLYLPSANTESPPDSATTDSSISQEDDDAPQPKR